MCPRCFHEDLYLYSFETEMSHSIISMLEEYCSSDVQNSDIYYLEHLYLVDLGEKIL